MRTDIGELENLARRAVERLRNVSAERDRLRGEVDALRNRLGASDPSSGVDDSTPWESEKARILAYVEETLTELGND